MEVRMNPTDRPSPEAVEPLMKVRAICMALPQVEERPSHGEAAWFFQGKSLFVMFVDHHHDESVGIWCAAHPGAQTALVASNPTAFYVPPYFGKRGWVGVRLDVLPVDWDEVAEVIAEGYASVSKK